MTTLRTIALFVAAWTLAPTGVIAATPAHAPSLSVHESCYGTSLKDGHRENIQGLELRIVSHSVPGTSYQVECFFLKRGKKGARPSVDDVIIFDITDPHGLYRVMAKPIPVGSASSISGKTGKTSGKKSASAKTSPSPVPAPREGFLVRILCEGVLMREFASSHSVERLAAEDPELFIKASSGKKVRTLDAGGILVH